MGGGAGLCETNAGPLKKIPRHVTRLDAQSRVSPRCPSISGARNIPREPPKVRVPEVHSGPSPLLALQLLLLLLFSCGKINQDLLFLNGGIGLLTMLNSYSLSSSATGTKRRHTELTSDAMARPPFAPTLVWRARRKSQKASSRSRSGGVVVVLWWSDVGSLGRARKATPSCSGVSCPLGCSLRTPLSEQARCVQELRRRGGGRRWRRRRREVPLCNWTGWMLRETQ